MDKIRNLHGRANVTVNLSPGQKPHVKRLAKESGRTIAGYTRAVIAHALDHNWTFEVRLTLIE